MIALVIGFLMLGETVGERSDLEMVQSYKAALDEHDIETALSFLAEEYELRFVGTEFVMRKADLPPILGWDKGVNGRVEWKLAEEKTGALTFDGREKNDFFDLLGIAHLRFRTTFELDADGKIAEQSYEVLSGQPSWDEAMEPAVAWAAQHRPGELEEIHPDGQMIYTEEMGRRWVKLLREWKASQSKPSD